MISEDFRPHVCYTLTMSTLLAFLGVSLVVICVPGPDTALTIRNAISGHRRAGVATAAGVATGQLAWTIAASLGIAGLLLASAPAFQAVRWAGAAYLIFLGVRSLWSAVQAGHDRAAIPSRDPRRPSSQLTPVRAFRQGLLSNLANPKMAAFFLSLLPQFVPAGAGSLSTSLLLGATFCLMTFSWLTAYAVVIDRARHALMRGPVKRILDAAAGLVLVGFGIRLATD